MTIGIAPYKLTPRAVRVRNRCLVALAARRSLPVPSADDLALIGDGEALTAAWARWEATHTPTSAQPRIAAPAAVPTRSRRRTSALKIGAVAAAGLLGFVVGERFLPPAGAQASDQTVAQRWSKVDDNAAASLNAKLLAVASSEVPLRLRLSPEEMATLILRSPRRRSASVDLVEARVDSLLWLRGRLRGESRFEIGGEVVVARRGVAELRVKYLTVDGVETDPTTITRLVDSRPRTSDVNRLRFTIPRLVSALEIAGGPTR